MERSRHRDWEHFEHMADIGVRGFGKSKSDAFENAARALTAALVDLERFGRPKR